MEGWNKSYKSSEFDNESHLAELLAMSGKLKLDDDDDTSSVANGESEDSASNFDFVTKMPEVNTPDEDGVAELFDAPEKFVGWTLGVTRVARLGFPQWTDFGEEEKQGALAMCPDREEGVYASLTKSLKILHLHQVMNGGSNPSKLSALGRDLVNEMGKYDALGRKKN